MDKLRFEPMHFTLEHCRYGGKEIEYKFYRDICYVEHPVDVTYQTINIKEPVSIDGQKVDASRAPIFFCIGCAGFLSSTASSGGAFGPPGGGPGGPEKPGGMMPPPGAPSQIKSSEEWEAMAGGEGHAGVGITGIPLLGSMPPQMPGPMPGADEEGPAGPDGNRNEKLSMGYVVVDVGCRGRENQWPSGEFYGKAPAAIVDLKAAVRYLRHNRELIPGDTEKIIATGGSGGGWMSTLVAASGNCAWFDPYLMALGAAEERDDIFATYSTSPIIDHENADGGIEWQGGCLLTNPKDIAWSQEIVEHFRQYLTDSDFHGGEGYGKLTLDNLDQYILQKYLWPDATRYLKKLSPSEREAYLISRPWIHWDGESARFTFRDFGSYAPRNANVPSFDDLELSQPSPDLYGDAQVAARNFTDFSIRKATGDPEDKAPQALVDRYHSVNPTWHILQRHSDVAPHWWIRHGACDSCTSVAPAVLLAVAAENAGKDVNLRLVWDGGHCEDDDPEAFHGWLRDITGYTL